MSGRVGPERTNERTGVKMEPQETILSDMHVRATSGTTSYTWLDPACVAGDDSISSCAVDADGDVAVKRRRRSKCLQLAHSKDGTSLADVGLQVWRGALLLCDYLIHHAERFRGPPSELVVLEMGSGCGLCSLMAAQLGARLVYATDVGDGVLHNLSANVDANGLHDVRVRAFDWCLPWVPGDWREDAAVASSYNWRASDRAALSHPQRVMILAADVVYDDDLTAAFIVRLADVFRWMQSREEGEGSAAREVTAVVAIERRLNFVLDSLSTRAPAAEHFEALLATALKAGGAMAALRLDEPPLGALPQAMAYERCPQLALYELSLLPAVGAGACGGTERATC